MEIPEVKIQGGKYKVIDTEDGFYTVLDVPIMSEVAKGVKDAPEPIDKEWLSKAVKIIQDKYVKNQYAGPVHIGHNDGKSKARFAGYFLPKRVDQDKNDGDKWTVFADLKLNDAAFQLAAKGELPYLSPEIYRWEDGTIDSVAFLDTVSPHFKKPLFTLMPGQVVKNPGAKFEAKLENPAMFEDKPKAKPEEKPEGAQCCAHCASFQKMIPAMAKMMGVAFDAKPMSATPVTQEGANMDNISDPKVAAQFAAIQAQLDARAKKDEERELKEKTQALADKAVADLNGYQISDTLKSTIATFAAMGEDKVKIFVEEYKKGVPKLPPKSVADFQGANAVSLEDPVFATFKAQGPDAVERAMKLFPQWKAWTTASKSSITFEKYVASQPKS